MVSYSVVSSTKGETRLTLIRAANFGHLTDVQGKVPGSMSINASSIYEDGLQIPIVKLFSKGVMNNDMVEVFCRNSRLPEWFRSDLTALIAACRTAATRVCELCDRYGPEVRVVPATSRPDLWLTHSTGLSSRNRRAPAT